MSFESATPRKIFRPSADRLALVVVLALGLLALACLGDRPTRDRSTPEAGPSQPAFSDDLSGGWSDRYPDGGRGREVYDVQCRRCHGRQLEGGEGGGPFRGDAFRKRWAMSRTAPSGETLADYITQSMPPGAGGSLSKAEAAGLVSLLAFYNRVDLGPIWQGAEAEAAEDREWHYYGGDAGSQRYSPLDQIDGDNFDRLEIAWRWSAANFGPAPEYNYRATPIMVDGTLFVTAGLRRAVVAIEAATGETLWTWRFDEGARGDSAPRSNSGRGVAWWSDDAPDPDERIFVVTPAYQLFALDARTGLPIPDFGRGGRVDLRVGLDRELDPETAPIGSSSPPIVVGDVVIVGGALADGSRPPSLSMPPGHVRAYDVRSGERRWIFHTIPQPGEAGVETWPGDAWKTAGNTAVWTTMSADLERGLVYLPVEAATGDFWGGHRLGDNLFTQSLVCLDASTGERIWHYQTVHHDVWDYDLPAAPILLDVEHDGRIVPAVAQVTKQGFTFVFDRTNGEPLWPIEERPVPQSDVPGERLSATQPFPTRPPPFEPQGVSRDDALDLTPELHGEALEIFDLYRLGPLYTPGSLRDGGDGKLGTLIRPSTTGGANWPGGAFDPETGMLYVGSSTTPGVISLGSDPSLSPLPTVQLGYPMPTRIPGGLLPLFKPLWGRITAIDLTQGDHAWWMPNGDVHPLVRDHPALEGVELPRTGRPDRAGLLVTKTILVAGEGGGMYGLPGGGGPMLRAHDKATGEILGEIEMPANQTGLPTTYAVDGRQYIVIAIGAPGHPGELVAYALP